ncbi:MAG: hypothetical protein ABR968_00575 [Bacteroidales bacterium]|jgi:hypothetical protein
MKFLSNILIIVLFAGMIFFSSCEKPPVYPPYPIIQYVSFIKDYPTGENQKGALTISFTDGDANFGLAPSDTLAPYNSGSKFYYNLFIIYYEKQNGVYVAVKLPFSENGRIPVVTPAEGTTSLKGIIQDSLYINNPLSLFDTIAFDVSIADRDLHVSNVIRTPDIIVNKH